MSLFRRSIISISLPFLSKRKLIEKIKELDKKNAELYEENRILQLVSITKNNAEITELREDLKATNSELYELRIKLFSFCNKKKRGKKK